MNKFIFHVVDSEIWEKVQYNEFYENESLKSVGFIHACTEDQIAFVLKTHFNGKSGLLILKLNTEKLKSKIKYEAADGYTFPHIFGPIEISAVELIFEINSP